MTGMKGTDHKQTNEPPHDKTNKMACAPSEDSGHLGICPDWSVFTVRMKKAVLPIEHTAKTWIRLGGCPVWSESLLGTQIIMLVLSWGGSNHSLWHLCVTKIWINFHWSLILVLWNYVETGTTWWNWTTSILATSALFVLTIKHSHHYQIFLEHHWKTVDQYYKQSLSY